MSRANNAFSKAAWPHHRLLRRLEALALLTMALGVAPLRAQPVNSVPVTATAPFKAAKPVPADIAGYVNNKADAPEMRALKNEFAKTDMGANLLRFAQAHHMEFVLDAELGKRHSRAEYDPQTGNILIRPGQKLESLVIYTAHEIRHGWQDKVLHAVDMEKGVMTPWQRWTLRRYLEADAEAFSTYFEADRLQHGISPQPGFAEAKPESRLALRLQRELASADGLTFAKYRRLAFEPALGSLFTYNARQLDLIDDMTMTLGKRVLAASGDPQKLAALEKLVAAAPDDKTFSALLRHFGGVSFDPKAETSLQTGAVSDAILLNDYPRRENNADVRASFPAVLDKDIGDMTALQDSYIRLLRDSVKPAPSPPARPAPPLS